MNRHQYTERNGLRALGILLMGTIIFFIVIYGTYRLFFYEPFRPIGNEFSWSGSSYYNSRLREAHNSVESGWAFLAFIVSFLGGMVVTGLVEHYTEWITPIGCYEMILLRKEIDMQAAPGRGFGNVTQYHFWFLNEQGEEVYFLGNNKAYFFLIEGNKVKIYAKLQGIVDFEIVSVA